MAQSTLLAIKNKVRLITSSPSLARLSDPALENYINTFVLYDFPEHLRLLNLKKTFTFYTQPFQDVYTSSTNPTDPLYDFKNRVISVEPPLYIAGVQGSFTQSREQFYSTYSNLQQIQSTGFLGDGATQTFTGIISSVQPQFIVGNLQQNICIIKNSLVFSSVDSSFNKLVLVDYPVSPTIGALGLPNIPQTLPSLYGQINYLTGAYTINFPSAPGSEQQIFSQAVIANPGQPRSMLFYDGDITLRPVPDKAYQVVINAFVQPVELIQNSQEPELKEWWQYIAYGAAKKVFEDRLDYDSINLILPSLKEQEMLIQRRTLTQMSTQRAPTIYVNNYNTNPYGIGWFGGNNY